MISLYKLIIIFLMSGPKKVKYINYYKDIKNQ